VANSVIKNNYRSLILGNFTDSTLRDVFKSVLDSMNGKDEGFYNITFTWNYSYNFYGTCYKNQDTHINMMISPTAQTVLQHTDIIGCVYIIGKDYVNGTKYKYAYASYNSL